MQKNSNSFFCLLCVLCETFASSAFKGFGG
jgi:hypothetical protein